jgi:flagellar assembly protein FliH
MANIDNLTFEEAKLWNLPSVDDEQAKLDGDTDAFNRPKNRWKFEAPDVEEQIKPITAKEIEEIRAAAYQEGLLSGHKEGVTQGHCEGLIQGKEQGINEGNDKGFAAGKAESKEQVDSQMLTLANLIENVKTPTAQINDDVKSELVLLATNLAKAIIKTDVQQNPQILMQAINEGIKTLPVNESHYQITLHPDDIAAATAHFGDQHIQDNKWQLIASSELSRGGCHIHTTVNAVDVSIERRSEQVFTQLLLSQGLVDDPRAR